jgi:hypothetical protein
MLSEHNTTGKRLVPLSFLSTDKKIYIPYLGYIMPPP